MIADITQASMIELPQLAKHPARVVRTVYLDERELINDLLWLHNQGQGVEVDPCFSIGRFWRGLPKPIYKFDIDPQLPDVKQSDARHLPFVDSTVKSIMFDPPFIANTSEDIGMIGRRFSVFKTMGELEAVYAESLTEFYRILSINGLLIFKCQDVIGKDGKQHLTHVFVINTAERIGFFSKDLFIFVRDNVPLGSNVKQQHHARKTHSYYLVFTKQKALELI